MNWDAAIILHRAALLRVLAVLVAAVGAGVATVPRHVHSSILRVLRPAESALRRLIVIAARGLSMPTLLAPRLAAAAKPKGGVAARGGPGFAIADRRLWTAARMARAVSGPGPRISLIGAPGRVFEPQKLATPDDPVDAARLCRRLQAAQAVLEDLPRYAQRMARWQGRQVPGPLKLRKRRALRPGRPPGYRQRVVHPVDSILHDCHGLALLALVPPDTS